MLVFIKKNIYIPHYRPIQTTKHCLTGLRNKSACQNIIQYKEGKDEHRCILIVEFVLFGTMKENR